jgi:hypothetical protein
VEPGGLGGADDRPARHATAEVDAVSSIVLRWATGSSERGDDRADTADEVDVVELVGATSAYSVDLAGAPNGAPVDVVTPSAWRAPGLDPPYRSGQATASAPRITPATTIQGASAAPGGAGDPQVELDELARRLYPTLRDRLKAELRLDRERAGRITDLPV